MTTALPEHLTIAQVSELIQVPVATLRDWRTDGRGPKCWKAGAQLRYRRRDLEAWIDAQQVVKS